MTETNEIRRKLEEDLARLRARAERIDDHRHERGREVPQDWSELAQYRSNDEVVEALDAQGRVEIRQIEETLNRMDAGTWGTCTRCEEPIEARRLEALPTATLCITCQRALEKP